MDINAALASKANRDNSNPEFQQDAKVGSEAANHKRKIQGVNPVDKPIKKRSLDKESWDGYSPNGKLAQVDRSSDDEDNEDEASSNGELRDPVQISGASSKSSDDPSSFSNRRYSRIPHGSGNIDLAKCDTNGSAIARVGDAVPDIKDPLNANAGASFETQSQNDEADDIEKGESSSYGGSERSSGDSGEGSTAASSASEKKSSYSSSSSSSSSSSLLGTQVNQAPFVQKLYAMLEDDKLSAVMKWGSDEASFLINPNEQFSRMLCLYFKHTNISSFVRQLSMYGFHKVAHSQDESQKDAEQFPWKFRHMDLLFKRGDIQSLRAIKRRSTRQIAGKRVKYVTLMNGQEPSNHSYSVGAEPFLSSRAPPSVAQRAATPIASSGNLPPQYDGMTTHAPSMVVPEPHLPHMAHKPKNPPTPQHGAPMPRGMMSNGGSPRPVFMDQRPHNGAHFLHNGMTPDPKVQLVRMQRNVQNQLAVLQDSMARLHSDVSEMGAAIDHIVNGGRTDIVPQVDGPSEQPQYVQHPQYHPPNSVAGNRDVGYTQSHMNRSAGVNAAGRDESTQRDRSGATGDSKDRADTPKLAHSKPYGLRTLLN